MWPEPAGDHSIELQPEFDSEWRRGPVSFAFEFSCSFANPGAFSITFTGG
jgi:hypothetical protein